VLSRPRTIFPSRIGIYRRIEVDQSIETFFHHKLALSRSYNKSRLSVEVASVTSGLLPLSEDSDVKAEDVL
jgi:hypothetical protein